MCSAEVYSNEQLYFTLGNETLLAAGPATARGSSTTSLVPPQPQRRPTGEPAVRSLRRRHHAPVLLRPAIGYQCAISTQETSAEIEYRSQALKAYAHDIGFEVTDMFLELDPDQERSCFKYLILALNNLYGRGQKATVILPTISALGPTRNAQADLLHILGSTGANILVMS